MTILNRIAGFISALVAPSDDAAYPDAIAYHGDADERELRFSRINALRRYY
jgi:hypothetical protein